MKRLAFSSLIALTFLSFAFAQQQNETPAWDVTLAQNTTARSNLTVHNRCAATHQFKIETENVPFLNFSQTQISVNGGQSANIPVQFDTNDIAPGFHQGAVFVICLTCNSEPTCTQDRERLQVKLNVTASTQNQPTGNQNPKPDPDVQTVDDQTDKTNAETEIPSEKTPRVVAISDNFKKNPCPELKQKCDELKQKAAQKESAATDAQSEADDAKSNADAADKKADSAEAEAERKERIAEPPAEGGTITDENRGETYSQADNDYLEAKKQALFAEYQAGKISAKEQQQRRDELSGPDALKNAREERLANLENLKKEADEAKKEADKARSEAGKAEKEAEKKQNAADTAKNEAETAISDYEKCIKKLEEECRKIQAAIAKAEKEKKAREAEAIAAQAAADKKKREEAERKKAEEAIRVARAEEVKYLLDNIKKLGLIDSSPFKDVPGAFDAVVDHIIPDILGKTAEGVVSEMVQGAAEYTANSPIPISSIQALGGLYQVFAKRFDPCSPLGSPRITQDLQGITNPKTKRNYTGDEALDKTFRMCKLLKELRDKVKTIQRLHQQQTK